MAGPVTQKDIKALEKKIADLQGIIVKLGKGQEKIDGVQMDMLKNHSQRFKLISERFELVDKKIEKLH